MARAKSIQNEPKCTPIEFDGAIVFFSVDPATIDRVRRVLVDGVPPPIVAQKEGVSQQLLHRQYTKVLKKIIERRSPPVPSEVLIPPGWESVTLIAPTEFIAMVKKQLAHYLQAAAERPSP